VATIVEFEGVRPSIADGVWIAPTAALIGNVTVERGASIWFGAVLRGDFARIVVGEGSCVQDNVMIHAAGDQPTIIGSDVAVGHLAILEGCVIDDGALIGMGAIVMQRARVGPDRSWPQGAL
jgi:carbonic anhydrase/acetyltransferase-like protein (isoleucine patch superfamily)